MEITIPIGQILSFDWRNLISWQNLLVVNVLYGIMAHYRGLYYVKKWNRNSDLRQKIIKAREIESLTIGKHPMKIRELNNTDMFLAFCFYLGTGILFRFSYAACRTSWNVLFPILYVICVIIFLSRPKNLSFCPSWKNVVINDCWIGESHAQLYLPVFYQFLLTNRA